MASVSFHIANLLDKMTSSDKDFRFMATNDLMSELQKDSIKLDDDSERKVVKMLLRLLEDKNGEVQNLAVKCLGPLVTKVKEYQVETIVDILCSNMMSDKEQLRDISSIGLKTVIAELPTAQPGPNMPPIVSSVCKKITGKLTAAIANKDDVSVQLEALDILADLLSRFGGMLLPFHANIQEALLPQLASPRLAVRKRAIIAIGYLVLSCSNGLYNSLLDYLLNELAKNSSLSTTRTYIQCIGTVSRQAGHRFGEHLDRVMPLVMGYCKNRTEDVDDELREHCLQAFESFVRRCPKEITPSVPMIMDLCCEFISHDPNYNYEEDGVDGMECDDEENESDDEYSDDDDMSWKVRRASAKCLEAIIATRQEMVPTFYRSISPVLIDRFKEREENVQADILHCYVTLLKMTRPSIGPTKSDPDTMDHTEAPVLMLQQQVPQIVRAVARHMKDKSMKRRQGCFQLLTELVQVLPEALSDHMTLIIPALHFSLSEKCQSSNMKMETLTLIHVLLSTHSPVVFHPHMPTLLPSIIAAVDDSFYKITSEALLVTQQLVKVIRPLDMPSNFDFTPYTDSLYQCTLIRLKAADIDQEVKERAIACMGTIISHLGDHLQAELQTCLPIFLDRLRNEITRLTAVKALTHISASPLRVDLRLILGDAFPILASFLRKNQRALKLCTLGLLNKLVQNYNSVTVAMLNKVLVELPPLLTESELHIAQLTLVLLTSIAQLHPQALYNINDAILPEIFKLLGSPLLQGAALNSLLKLFQALVHADIPGVGYRDLLDMLMTPVHRQVSRGDAVQLHKQMKFSDSRLESIQYHKQIYHSVAKCVAALTVTQKATGATSSVVGQLVNDVQRGSRGTEALCMFSLLALGEIGRHIDLSSVNGLQECILNSFSSSSEEVKSAAAFALGGVSTGNLPYFLPTLLNEIQSQPRRLYLLLHSLKEIISHLSRHHEGEAALAPWINRIWEELFNHCECSEEGTRNVVAECLGKLTLLDPSTLLPRLKAHLKHPSGLMRATVVTAIKFTISDQPSAIDGLLRSCIGEFLATLVDPELNVRRVALVAFNSAAHNKPSLIRDLLDTVLPHLYNETKVRRDLIREVEMGPFKHTVDDGLDVRKAAWECMYTLLDAGACRDRLDVYEFVSHVEDGLRDHYDIQMLTYLMLVRLAQLCPNAALQRMESLIEPLRATCMRKVKANSVKQEYEKQDELKRSAMRAFNALAKVPDADKNPAVNDFLTNIKVNSELQALYDSVQKDNSGNTGPVGTPPDAVAMDIS